MPRYVSPSSGLVASFVTLTVILTPGLSPAHPLGNFSISQYTGIRVKPDAIELRYLVDMAEIPTFQEIQETGIMPEAGHPSLRGYLARKAESLKEGLVLELEGRRLALQTESSEAIFPPGAGGLPTLKLGMVYRATLSDSGSAGPSRLRYRDVNFAGRAGWKEIIALGAPGVRFMSSSVPEKDRSQELADYPTDLLNSPPQVLEAQILFTREGGQPAVASAQSGGPQVGPAVGISSAPGPTPTPRSEPPSPQPGSRAAGPGAPDGDQAVSPKETGQGGTAEEQLRLEPNRQGTPRSAFTDLMTTKELGFGIVLVGLAVAAALGAFHALEPGHGKTVVAAYLIGSRGTAWHAVWLGLIVTASHTAGVYLLGGVTLYASRYVVPERLYPWLGVVSGLAIAGLGFTLFLRRYAGGAAPHGHSHGHGRDHGHHHHGHGQDDAHEHSHDHDHAHDHQQPQHPVADSAEAGPHHHSHKAEGSISFPALVALGVTGGIVPCPAALVVLLSALSLNRVGFGLLLIVAFSVGLAAVLIAIGMLMVYARRFMARFQGEGPLITRWLPLTSSAVITLLGLGIAVQALMAARILEVHL